MVDPPASPGDDSVVTMVHCSDCGHMVPETNLVIHQATACVARARARLPSSPFQRRATAPPEWQDHTPYRQPATWSTTERNPEPQQQHHDNRKQDDSRKHDDMIDLVNDNDKKDDDDVQVVTEWACPRCTLLNPMSEGTCSVCQYIRQRSADPVRRDRLVNETEHDYYMSSSPASLVGGGALLGSVIGAAGAFMRGNSLGRGVIEGAMTGAMGGAVVDTLFRPQQPVASRSTNPYQPQYSYQQPRSSFRVSSGSGMVTTTMIRSPDGSTRTVTDGGVDPLLSLMLANVLNANSPNRANIDGMSYEQLLQTFGDGSENRGADESVISSLPTSQVTRNNPISENNNECPICLETFREGDTRKTLPCLHGFHAQCVDKWLRANGSCPICKHSVS